jgi:hypothetical protein
MAVAVGHEDGHADRADALQPTGRLDGIDLSSSGETVRALAETTLALVLFSDASRIDLGALRRTVGMPVRLLGIGLPLTIALGAAAAAAVFGELTMGEALILAVVLAPTDAALGQAVVTEPPCRGGSARPSTSRAASMTASACRCSPSRSRCGAHTPGVRRSASSAGSPRAASRRWCSR